MFVISLQKQKNQMEHSLNMFNLKKYLMQSKIPQKRFLMLNIFPLWVGLLVQAYIPMI